MTKYVILLYFYVSLLKKTKKKYKIKEDKKESNETLGVLLS